MSDLPIDWTRYHRYDELTTILRGLADRHPDLVRLYSIGKSHRGRDIWVMELTDRRTGKAEDKPAFYVDANCHGEEVLGASVALYTIVTLLRRQADDPWAQRLLAERVLYILPNINPDGSEISLTTPYHHVGNGHYLPWEFRPARGLYPADVNNDGKILQMRVPDPSGEWKVSDRDPRLLVRREPGEFGGEYYRLYPEGFINGYDGVDVEIPRPPHGNLNRQFPVFWGPEREEYGAGDLPLNEPEAAAVARFILAHRNIAGALAHHTHGALLLRPSSYRPDAELPPEDVELFKVLGGVGERLTGYKLVSIFEDFTFDKRFARHGGFGDWLYEHLGIPFLATELWDLETEAGLRPAASHPRRGRGEEEQLALLQWLDRHLDGEGFIPWQPFDHPQLGRVEIGGWDAMAVIRNAPGRLVEKVAAPVAEFTLRLAASTPLVRVVEAETEPLGAELYRVRAVVKNLGYLPTYLTQLAREQGIIPGVTVTVTTQGAELVMNDATQDLGHLDGVVNRRQPWSGWGRPWGAVARRAEWLVRRKAGSEASVEIAAESQKGGVHRVRLPLTAHPERRSH